MTKGKIGVQMMMLKNKVEELGVYETMKKIHELGFGAVEVSQIPMTEENVAELKRASEDFNIKIAALSAALEPMFPDAPGEALSTHFEKVVNDCKTLDCNFVRIGMLPFTVMGDKEKIMGFIGRAEEMAHRLAEHGIELYYHTHHVEFEKYDGVYLLDLIKQNTTKLGFELDVHWIQRAGENPVKIIEQYKNRISLLHLKDYRIASVEFNPEDLKDMARFMNKFFNIIEFAELGEGNLDIAAMMDAGLQSGVQYFLIEQDDTYGRDPFECLEVSAQHLRKLGYADWF
ncbi:MAG TPA: sugar phosphate isomerase/epimerase [Chondromyces sp.]|nr:sugar phosphate isomerase/epimerase [Chondromyces sp.]